MASGLPVIGANSRALPEFIDKNNGMVVEVGDYKTLAKEIVKILSNSDLEKKLDAGGVVTASKFSLEAITKEWEEIYIIMLYVRKI
jgi:glycosyltransferase involved in cell wall biosynthesis